MNWAVCKICDLIWSVTIMAGCAYIVFFLGHSGWWFVLATALACAWQCGEKQ